MMCKKIKIFSGVFLLVTTISFQAFSRTSAYFPLPQGVAVNDQGVPDLKNYKGDIKYDADSKIISGSGFTSRMTSSNFKDGDIVITTRYTGGIDSLRLRPNINPISALNNTTQIIIDKNDKIKQLITCKTAEEEKKATGFWTIANPTCTAITADSCNVQNSLIEQYFGSDKNMQDKIVQCTNLIKQVNHINQNFNHELMKIDSTQFLQSNSALYSAIPTGIVKWLEAKVKDIAQLANENGTNNTLSTIMGSIRFLEDNRKICESLKSKLAPSNALPKVTFSGKTCPEGTMAVTNDNVCIGKSKLKLRPSSPKQDNSVPAAK